MTNDENIILIFESDKEKSKVKVQNAKLMRSSAEGGFHNFDF